MIRKQHEVRIEPVHAVGSCLRTFHHPEQVGRMAEVVARLDQIRALRSPVRGGHDGRHDSGERDGLFERGFGERLGCTLGGDDGAQRVHGIAGGIQ